MSSDEHATPHSPGRRDGLRPASDATAAAPETFAPPPPGDPPRDVSDAPPPPELVATEPRSEESQWALVLREFKKRRVAVAASWMILLLVTLAIFAPLLANDRPIAYRGANRYEYAEASRAVSALLASAARESASIPATLRQAAEALEQTAGVPPEWPSRVRQAAGEAERRTPRDLSELQGDLDDLVTETTAAAETKRAPASLLSAQKLVASAAAAAGRYALAEEVVPARLRDMAAAVVPETGAQIDALSEEVRSALADRLTEEEARDLRRRLRDYPADEVPFVGRWRFPVFAVLGGMAIGFMVLNALAVALLLARLVSRGPWRKRTRRTALTALVTLPIVVGAGWELTVPEVIDRTPYKRGVPAAEAGENPDAPVLYETELWPPVPYGLDETDLDEKFARPAIVVSETEERESVYDAPHWLGTDKIGRDVLSRMLWGGRVSLAVGVVSVAIYVAIGIFVGAVAGFFRGWVDMVVSRLIEIVIVFPAFFLILTIVAFLGPSLWNIMIVIGLTGWTGVARLVRGEFLRLADQEFVLAGRALGYSAPRLIFRHVLPNAMAPVLVAATFGVAGAILTESALSFLGIGITVPTPSWGGILAEGRDFLRIAPWLIYIPGLTIFVTILCYNLAGEALRDASDPRLRGSR
ncbi:MAG TPA: ABC transporter permease [Planctomycetaceae bacterium]